MSHEDKTASMPLRVLFFEDCRPDVDLCLDVLRSAGFAVSADVAVTKREFLERLQTNSYELILSDYRMPQATGMDMFARMKAEGLDIPFVLVTRSEEHTSE